jgi:hypothetical protein
VTLSAATATPVRMHSRPVRSYELCESTVDRARRPIVLRDCTYDITDAELNRRDSVGRLSALSRARSRPPSRASCWRDRHLLPCGAARSHQVRLRRSCSSTRRCNLTPSPTSRKAQPPDVVTTRTPGSKPAAWLPGKTDQQQQDIATVAAPVRPRSGAGDWPSPQGHLRGVLSAPHSASSFPFA